ncbi:MAG: hypothetical protein PHD40_00060 [Syntrophomonadaceae bacterium]|nr:hypothetical protein [Syntrophomonadaceae bacterium]
MQHNYWQGLIEGEAQAGDPLLRGKTLLLTVIFAAIYVSVMLNNPDERLKAAGYNQLLDWYGLTIVQFAELEYVHNPGLRVLNDNSSLSIEAVVPDGRTDYADRLDNAILSCQAIVECSGMDSWHTTSAGQKYLGYMRDKIYRIVVFDGGHHLPTLGTRPDIIIVPVFKGYAVHSYMRDGMKVECLTAILKAIDSPSVVVTVPRFFIVKSTGSLTEVASRVIRDSLDNSMVNEENNPGQANRYGSRYKDCLFAYISNKEADNWQDFLVGFQKLYTEDINQVYLAFNYNEINRQQAQEFAQKLQTELGVPVEIVNSPVKVADLIWSDN